MRLNAVMKKQVIDKAIAHRFKDRKAAMVKERHALGMALYDSLYGDRALKRALASVPTALLSFPRYTEGVGAYASTVATFTIGGEYHNYPVLATVPIPHNARMTITDQALVDRHRAYMSDAEKLEADQSKVVTTLTAMLGNIQTDKRLAEDWPEGRQFYKSLPKDFPFNHQVPAVQIAELNSLLGLT